MPANQITAISGSTSLTYDANGNLLTDDQGEVLTYDGWNRLVSVASTTGTMIATYSYEGAGDLISETEGGTTTDIYYSASQEIETRTAVTCTSSGTVATNTIYSPDYQNDVLAQDSGGTRLYFTHDANYDVTAVISTAGAVDQRMAYDSYGKVTFTSNSGTVTTDGYNLTHLWQGGLRDAATGMYHFGARWYSVSLQTWVSQEPGGAAYVDGMDLYEADADNPIDRVDPFGLCPAAPVDAVWHGSVEATNYAWIMGGGATLHIHAEGVDAAGKHYTIDMDATGGPADGNAALGAGRFHFKAEFSNITAPAQWPVDLGSKASAVAIGVNAPPIFGLGFARISHVDWNFGSLKFSSWNYFQGQSWYLGTLGIGGTIDKVNIKK